MITDWGLVIGSEGLSIIIFGWDMKDFPKLIEPVNQNKNNSSLKNYDFILTLFCIFQNPHYFLLD